LSQRYKLETTITKLKAEKTVSQKIFVGLRGATRGAKLEKGEIQTPPNLSTTTTPDTVLL
jgi:hypothetical protein